MKEYTLIFTADITCISVISDDINEIAFDKEVIAKLVKERLKADDVKVKKVRVFERDL